MPSRYYVEPGIDVSRGLSGLSQVIGEVRERKRAKEEQMRQQARMEAAQEEIFAAMQSGDPMEIARVSLQYPEFQETISKTLGTTGEMQANEERQFLGTILSNPDRAQDLYEQRIQKLESQGRDATHTRQSYQDYLQNPEQELQQVEQLYAMQFPDEYTAFKKATAPADVGAVSGVQSFVDQEGNFVGTYDLSNPQDRAFVLRNNLRKAPSRIEQGEPGEFTRTQRGKMEIDLREAEIGTRQAIETADTALRRLEENPDAFAQAGSLARIASGLSTEVEALARVGGIDIPQEVQNIAQYADTFKELGVTNTEAQGTLLDLALAYAGAIGLGQGRALSDRDIRLAMRRIGASGLNTPEGRKAAIQDVRDILERNFRIRYKVMKGEEFRGDFGTQDQKTPDKSPRAINPETGEVLIFKDGQWQAE